MASSSLRSTIILVSVLAMLMISISPSFSQESDKNPGKKEVPKTPEKDAKEKKSKKAPEAIPPVSAGNKTAIAPESAGNKTAIPPASAPAIPPESAGDKPKKGKKKPKKPKKDPKDKPKEDPKGKPKDKPKENPKDKPKEDPKDKPKEDRKPKKDPDDKPKEDPDDKPKEDPKEKPKEDPDDKSKESEELRNVCNSTASYKKCLDALKSDPRASTADYKLLAEIAIDLGYKKATEIVDALDTLAKGTKDKRLKKRFKACAKYYKTAFDNLDNAKKYLRVGEYQRVEDEALDALEESGACEGHFIVGEPVEPKILSEKNREFEFQIALAPVAIEWLLSKN